MVDKLYVVCKARNCNNVREMFSDDPAICVVECRDDDQDVQQIVSNLPNITRKFLSGGWGGKHIDTSTDITVQFYDHMGFSREIKQEFAYFCSNNLLVFPVIPYIFTHSTSSHGTQLNFKDKWDSNSILTIDPNHNSYPRGHKWHDLAEQYINHPILRYLKVIENANELHVTDSSFYCLSCFVSSRATKKACYDRTTGVLLPHYSFM
jgi:hypothetical protein